MGSTGMRMAFLGCLAALAACGPKAGDEDTGASASTSASSSASTSSSGGSVDSSTGAPSCEIYDAAPDVGPAVAITVRHEGTTPVYFGPHGCGGAIAVAITSGGSPVAYLLDSECFPNTCDGFVASEDCFVGCADCGTPQAGRIEAGATGEAAWPGHTLTELELIDACAPAPDCPDTCRRLDQAAPGTYELTLTVYRSCTSSSGTCECDAPGSGVCSLWNGDEQLADPATFSATIEYPAQTMAEIVITD